MPKLSRRKTVSQFSTYQSYKSYLREDFQYRCVYCAIHENENGGPRGFTVEHFRPKSLFPHLTTDYENLLYGCNVCNPYKGNDWPSDTPLVDGVGYLDPCEHDYDDHFRLNGFEVVGITRPAWYMVERLHLNRTQLIKLRQRRWDEERLHAQTVQELHDQLELLEVAIYSDQLPQATRQQFQVMKDVVTKRLDEDMANWQRRWEPFYELDDYR